jgi:AMP-polyphosphate phosphotransferase
MSRTPRVRLAKLRGAAKRPDSAYDKDLLAQQQILERIQHAYLFSGDRAVVVFEGMDAAGKGGTIRRIAWALDPRSLKVWPIGAPNEIEKRQHYLQRFWSKLPEKGQFSVFDRSWYGRLLVERVEGFAERPAWKRAYGEINDFEKQLTDDGIRVVKLFLHVSKQEQLRRFEERLSNPLKRWKLSYEDFRNRAKWDQYIEAAEDMFAMTSTRHAAWHVIQSDNKPAARVAALKIITDQLSKGIDLTEMRIDPKVVTLARRVLGQSVPRARKRR